MKIYFMKKDLTAIYFINFYSCLLNFKYKKKYSSNICNHFVQYRNDYQKCIHYFVNDNYLNVLITSSSLVSYFIH